MKRNLKILIGILGLIGFGLLFLLYLDFNTDSFKTDVNINYCDLTDTENEVFKWQNNDTFDIYQVYRKHMFDTVYLFPRQPVKTIRLFKNKPLIGIFNIKTLKENLNKEFIKFCNDSTNFDWGETTWEIFESEYCIKLYNNNQIVGKMYFCLNDCGMTESRPFCPSMKFGGLSNKGFRWINDFINNDNNWK